MDTLPARLLQATWPVVSLVLVCLVVALALLTWAGANDTEQLVGPFRWVPLGYVA